MKKSNKMTAEPCPEELVIALALEDPILDVDKGLAQKHINRCKACQALFEITKNSAQEADEAKRAGRNTPFPEKLDALLNSKEPEPIPWSAGILTDATVFTTRLNALPAWQLISESSDSPPIRHPITIDLPHSSALSNILRKDGPARVLQEAMIDASSLVGTADSEGRTEVWAKIAIVENDALQELFVVELQDIDIQPGENSTSIVVSMPPWLQLPNNIEWFCDLYKHDGSLLHPHKIETGPRSVLVTFAGTIKKEAFATKKNPIALRVLLVIYQEEKSGISG